MTSSMTSWWCNFQVCESCRTAMRIAPPAVNHRSIAASFCFFFWLLCPLNAWTEAGLCRASLILNAFMDVAISSPSNKHENYNRKLFDGWSLKPVDVEDVICVEADAYVQWLYAVASVIVQSDWFMPINCRWLVMAALCLRGPLYFCPVVSIFFFFLFFSSPNLSGHRYAARGSLQMQDPKKSPKIAIWAPSHNFVRLYLRN